MYNPRWRLGGREEKKVLLPDWLDNLIFKDLGANYCPQRSDMTNIDDNKVETLNYLGTYFPRSYAEAYCIFSEYFSKHKAEWNQKEELSIFDFGCGTGGEIIGLLTVLDEIFPNMKKVRIVALDGNQNALRLYEKVLSVFKNQTNIQIENNSAPIYIDDFYDLRIIDNVLNKKFDIIISFKAICEFVTKDQFEQQNPYEHIANFLLPKLRNNGIFLLEDVTSYNNTSQEWLPKMMDKGLNSTNCSIFCKNEGYNQTYLITHSQRRNDKSKVAWRMIK